MVLLLERINKLYSKLENHHHHHHHHQPSVGQGQPEALSASLQAFRSDVSICLNQLKPVSENLSFKWLRQCFGVIPTINKAFAKLVVDIDYPIDKWEAASVEEYLNYSLSLLGLFNSISSSFAYHVQARLSLAVALSHLDDSPSSAIERLKPVEPRNFCEDLGKGEAEVEDKEKISSGEEWIVHQALTIMKGISFWVCGLVLSCLYDDSKPYLEMRKSVDGMVNSPFAELDSAIYEIVMKKGSVLKEVNELNDAVSCLAAALVSEKSSEASQELEAKLEVYETFLDGLRKEVDHLFTEVLANRNKLVDCLRHPKQRQDV